MFVADKDLTILLADDMAHFLDLEVSFLRRADCRILTASDGAQALILSKQETPDLLLLDVEMPRMTGIEVCRLLRQDPGFKDTPIVMVTSTDRRDEAHQAGATDFWQKPIRENEFIEGIKKYVPIRIREEERVSVGLPVKVMTADGTEFDGMTRDVSEGGAFILASGAIQPNDELSCTISLGFDDVPTVTLSGIAVRVQAGEDGGVGIEFSGPDAELVRLQEYLAGL